MAPPKQRDLASSRWKQESKHIVLWPMSIGFGVRVGENSMKVMKNVAPVGTSILRLELNTESRIITAYFPLLGRTDVWNGTREFKLTIDVRQMRSTYCTELNGTFSLVLPLHFPPQYYWKSEISRNIGGAMHRYADGWSRATDVAMDMDASRGSPVALHNPVADPEYIDIGRWTTLRFILDAGTPESNRMIHTFCSALEDLNVACQAVSVFKILPKSEPLIWGRLDHPPITSTGALDLLERTSNVIHLEFSVRYQLEVCISRGWLNDHAVSEDFLLRLAAMDPIKARLCLEVLADQGKVLSNPMDLFDNPDTEAYVSNTRLPHYCALIRKAIVTPTTIRLNTPSAETSNRVIRKYNLIQDRFLRVQFLEESERGRIGASKPEHDKIYERLRRTMHQGIRIGERRYEFLAFGSSQLRECGAYFFCPTDGTSCDDIRRWMGQFDHIRVVAKYAARVGQCLSTTREIRSIHVPRIREASDVERNGHCFTDGVGVISGFLSRLIMEELAMDVFVEPSAFQFRMGGCKGVLAVWPQARGMEVQIRKSQEKFKAEFNGLEIIRCAKLATATLNRQTITILESLGVSQSAFLDLLDHQLHLFEKATEDTGIAIQLLTQLIDENQVTLIISEILKANFLSESSKEPFVANVLNLWRSWSLKLLKEKARIQVEQSAFVLGCVDETGSLRGHSSATEGCKIKDVSMLPQIFLQLSDPKIYNQTRIVQGVCIVGRNPSLHPGDIRVVEAVDEPKLRHLKDVVVFPSTGDRPLPNMLSGGDLDGDDFFVIWDPSLIPNEWNHPPMNYSGSKPCELQRDVNVDDMRDFFVSYVKNDVLPCVATAHLGFADNLGPKSPICLQLAELHSQAVDFPKTGEPVDWNFNMQPRRWPHFMEKKSSYQSQKALGRIYNKLCRQPIEFRPEWEQDFDQRVLRSFSPDSKTLDSARKIKEQYDMAVRRILAQHNIGTEFELWSGFAMTRPSVGTDYKRQEHLGREYDSLKQRFRQMCYDAAGGKDKIDPFVAAMYKVTEEQARTALASQRHGSASEDNGNDPCQGFETGTMPLITFPWIFHWVMIRLAEGGRSKVNGTGSSATKTANSDGSGRYETPREEE